MTAKLFAELRRRARTPTTLVRVDMEKDAISAGYTYPLALLKQDGA